MAQAGRIKGAADTHHAESVADSIIRRQCVLDSTSSEHPAANRLVVRLHHQCMLPYQLHPLVQTSHRMQICIFLQALPP